MPHRHGSLPELGSIIQTSYDLLGLARLTAEPIAALDPGIGPTQSSIHPGENTKRGQPVPA